MTQNDLRTSVVVLHRTFDFNHSAFEQPYVAHFVQIVWEHDDGEGTRLVVRQKVRKVTALGPSATRSAVSLTHWVVPTCLLASAKDAVTFGSIACGANAAHCDDRNTNGPEQANQNKKTHDG